MRLFLKAYFSSRSCGVSEKKSRFDGFLLGLYLIGYGAVRFLIEFVRQPDSQVGLVVGMLSMGQVLCLAMIILGIVVMLVKKRKGKTA